MKKLSLIFALASLGQTAYAQYENKSHAQVVTDISTNISKASICVAQLTRTDVARLVISCDDKIIFDDTTVQSELYLTTNSLEFLYPVFKKNSFSVSGTRADDAYAYVVFGSNHWHWF